MIQTNLSTEDTAEEPILSSEDTTIMRSVQQNLFVVFNRDAAEDGMGCSGTWVVPYLVAAGAPLVD